MIVSASRRTDLPAFYAEWLMGRLDAGYCLVRNPFDARRSSRVSLLPHDIDFLVLWTRDARSLIPLMADLDGRGIRSYSQITISAYPAAIEPGAPALAEALSAFHDLGQAVGKHRLVWRYDPIFVAEGFDAAFHRGAFERISDGPRGRDRARDLQSPGRVRGHGLASRPRRLSTGDVR